MKLHKEIGKKTNNLILENINSCRNKHYTGSHNFGNEAAWNLNMKQLNLKGFFQEAEEIKIIKDSVKKDYY